MNKGGLNSYAFNGRSLDAVVRSSIVGSAFAIATPKGSSVIGGLGVVIVGLALANATIVARCLARDTEGPVLQAVATPVTTRLVRDAVGVLMRADASPVGNSAVEVEVRSAILGEARADASPASRATTRSVIDAMAEAQSDPVARSAARSPLVGYANASGYVTPGSVIRYFFDENAQDENTFLVPYENNTFFVGDSMSIATITQQPRDIRDYDFDFSEWFPAGDVVTAVAVSVSPVGLTVGYALSAPRVKVWLRDGVVGTYKVTLLASTNDGRAKEVELKVKIKDY